MKSFRRPSGLCFACGRPTRLLVHQGCGGRDRKPRKKRAYTDAVISAISKQREQA